MDYSRIRAGKCLACRGARGYAKLVVCRHVVDDLLDADGGSVMRDVVDKPQMHLFNSSDQLRDPSWI